MTFYLVLINIAYILGVWLQHGTLDGAGFICSSIGLACGCWYSYEPFFSVRYNRIITFLLLSIGCIGICFFGYYRSVQQKAYQEQLYTLIAHTTCSIKAHIREIRSVQHLCFSHLLIIEVRELKCDQQASWLPFSGTIWIYTKQIPELRVDDLCTFFSIRLKPSLDTSFNQYLLKEGAVCSLFIPHLIYKVEHRPTWSVRRWLHTVYKQNIDYLRKKMSDKIFILYTKIFLGSKEINQSDFEYIKADFKIWGITHQLARSGLHMIIFASVWYMILRLIPLYFVYKQLLLIAISILYGVFSWSSIPFDRAFCTFILQKIAILFCFPVHFIHVLALICLITLIYNPIQVCFLDFQLSFGLTFALAFLNQVSLLKSKNL